MSISSASADRKSDSAGLPAQEGEGEISARLSKRWCPSVRHTSIHGRSEAAILAAVWHSRCAISIQQSLTSASLGSRHGPQPPTVFLLQRVSSAQAFSASFVPCRRTASSARVGRLRGEAVVEASEHCLLAATTFARTRPSLVPYAVRIDVEHDR